MTNIMENYNMVYIIMMLILIVDCTRVKYISDGNSDSDSNENNNKQIVETLLCLLS